MEVACKWDPEHRVYNFVCWIVGGAGTSTLYIFLALRGEQRVDIDLLNAGQKRKPPLWRVAHSLIMGIWSCTYTDCMVLDICCHLIDQS